MVALYTGAKLGEALGWWLPFILLMLLLLIWFMGRHLERKRREDFERQKRRSIASKKRPFG